ncbi:hypothetical protein D3C76_1641920 [compost metagenome]
MLGMLSIIAHCFLTVHIDKLEGTGEQHDFPGHVLLQRRDMRILKQLGHCEARSDHGYTDQGHEDEGETDAKRFHSRVSSFLSCVFEPL